MRGVISSVLRSRDLVISRISNLAALTSVFEEMLVGNLPRAGDCRNVTAEICHFLHMNKQICHF